MYFVPEFKVDGAVTGFKNDGAGVAEANNWPPAEAAVGRKLFCPPRENPPPPNPPEKIPFILVPVTGAQCASANSPNEEDIFSIKSYTYILYWQPKTACK